MDQLFLMEHIRNTRQNMEKSNWKVFARTQSYLKPYVISYIFFVLVSGLGQFLTFSSVGVFLKEIVLMVSSSTSDFTIQKGILYLLATFCFTCFMGFGIFNIKKIEQKIRVTLRKEMLNGYIHSDEKEVEMISDAEVMNRMSMDLTKMVDLVGWIMAGSIYMPVISGFLSVIYLCHVDFRIALLCVFISVIEYYLLRLFSKKRMLTMQGITLSKNEIVNFLNEEIDGAKEVRTYGLLTKFRELLDQKIVKLNQYVRRYNAMNATRLFVSMFYIECIEEVVLLIVGAYLSSIGAIVFANIMIAIQLSDQINQMIVASSVLKMFVDEYAVYEKRVFEIIDLKPQIETRKIDKDSVLRMEQVCFSYDKKEVLHDISFAIQKNQKIGIVGESGSGKSTIMKLLLGLYKPSFGTVSKMQNLSISYMPQDSSMFFTSVKNNISLSSQGSMKKIEESSLDAGANAFIEKKEDGYDHMIQSGEEGFSGGECQRISLARMFYQNADVFVLDEPTSALDVKTEKSIQNIVDKISDKTIVVVTHRLSFVENFDRIFVVDNGRVVEEGTHQQLLNQQGVYASMYRKQNGS